MQQLFLPNSKAQALSDCGLRADWRFAQRRARGGIQATLAAWTFTLLVRGLSGPFFCFARPWHDALAIAGCLVFWAQWPWGRWYTLHRCPRNWSGKPNAFERLVERFCDIGGAENDHLCLLVRMIIGLAPLAFYAWSPLPLLAAFAIVMAYEAAWRWGQSGREIRTAEALTGAILGACIYFI